MEHIYLINHPPFILCIKVMVYDQRVKSFLFIYKKTLDFYLHFFFLNEDAWLQLETQPCDFIYYYRLIKFIFTTYISILIYTFPCFSIFRTTC